MPDDKSADSELSETLKALAEALIHSTPEHFQSAYCVFEEVPVHGAGRLKYRIGSVDFPEEVTERPSGQLHEAAYQLFWHETRNGQTFLPVEFSVQRQPTGSWSFNLRRLDPKGQDLANSGGQQTKEELWDDVYRAREQFFTTHFGPLPQEIKKLMNLTGVWPGGGLFQFSALRQGGLGVCTSCGLSNADMPASVRQVKAARTEHKGQNEFSSELGARVPRWVPPDRAGYGYEMMVLTPTAADWPLLVLGWVVQMEILNDLDLPDRVAEARGVTVEALAIGDGSRKADFLIEPARDPFPERTRLPNGTMQLLIATRITPDEMDFALDNGRPALLERLQGAGVGQVSVLDRPSVIR
jgi:hypothetical protein